MGYAIGSFADLALLHGDRDNRRKLPDRRNVGARVVAKHACETCGARAGEPCTRPTVSGRYAVRGAPHFGRSPPLGWSAAFRVKGNQLEAR